MKITMRLFAIVLLISLLSSCIIITDTTTTTTTTTNTKDTDMTNDTELNLKKSDLSPLMYNIFDSNEVIEETVMFIDRGETKSLLYPIDEIIAVSPYSNPDAVYTEGKDYTVINGKLHIPESSAIKCITSDKYYNVESDMLKTLYNGKEVNTLFAEGQGITDYQIRVTYKHSTAWDGYKQECNSDIFSDFIGKLQKGEDVTVVFYGDSITYGASSSYIYEYAPYGKPFSLLFTEALADLFHYTVKYIDYSKKLSAGSNSSPKVPDTDYVGGDRGTITYINTSIGGMSSRDGARNAKEHLQEPIERYGCNLLVLGFGMNDGSSAPNITKDNLIYMIEAARSVADGLSVMLISTMIPNPDATNGWYAGQDKQEPALIALAEEYTDAGIPCATANMTSVSISLYEKKEFIDSTGNNINHPNDFLMRIYAITMLQSLLGYENIK